MEYLSERSYSILTCAQFVVGSNGTVDVQYNKGGVPTILVPTSVLENSGFCGNSEVVVQDTKGQLASSALSHLTSPASSFAFFLLFVFGLVNSGISL